MQTTDNPEGLADLLNRIAVSGEIHRRSLRLLCRVHRDENPAILLIELQHLLMLADDLGAILGPLDELRQDQLGAGDEVAQVGALVEQP